MLQQNNFSCPLLIGTSIDMYSDLPQCRYRNLKSHYILSAAYNVSTEATGLRRCVH